MLSDFFNHTCDIYHIEETEETPGFGLKASPAFSYPDEPDLEGVACHFAVKSFSHSVEQTNPANIFEARIKLTLPYDTDIRTNDKIVETTTGYVFTAEIPRIVQHNHHKWVYVKRCDAGRAL